MVGDGGGREEGETEGEDGRGEDSERFHEDVRDGFGVQEVRVELVSNSVKCQSDSHDWHVVCESQKTRTAHFR